MKEKIVEIKIKRVSELSESAQREVAQKLSSFSRPFNFKGYAQVTYTEASPYRVSSVDPIEGTINDFFNGIRNQFKLG